MASLEELTVDANLLSSLPQDFGNLDRLRSFSAACNNFVEFPSVLCSLPNLEFLDLNNNKIERVPEKVKAMSKLTHLNLAKNQFCVLDFFVCSFCFVFCVCC